MPNNTPIPDAKLAEVRRLHAAAVPVKRTMSWQYSDEEIVFYEATFNAFGPIIARLEAAERDRDELREELAYIKQQLEWVEENGDTYQKSALMDFIRRTIHGISHTAAIKEALAARDDQQRREGAIEALEYIAKDSGIDGGKAYIAKVVYREFPDLLHMSVGVVDASDLMQAAQRLRERGE